MIQCQTVYKRFDKKKPVLNGIHFDIPDGEISLTWCFDGNEEMITLFYLVNHIRRIRKDAKISLVMPYIPNADAIFMGGYDEKLSGVGGTVIRKSNRDLRVENGTHHSISFTWNNTYAYRDREFFNDAYYFTMRIGSAINYANTTAEIRIDSLDSEPIASIDVYSLFDGNKDSKDFWKSFILTYKYTTVNYILNAFKS